MPMFGNFMSIIAVIKITATFLKMITGKRHYTHVWIRFADKTHHREHQIIVRRDAEPHEHYAAMNIVTSMFRSMLHAVWCASWRFACIGFV